MIICNGGNSYFDLFDSGVGCLYYCSGDMLKTKIMLQVRAAVDHPLRPVRRGLQTLADVQRRERVRLAAEMASTRDLMPLLMKQRNGNSWSVEDRKKLKADVAALMHISPYLILFVAPGGFIAMPVLAWWLDRIRDAGGGGGARRGVHMGDEPRGEDRGAGKERRGAV